mgnify:CR=1 FL=1
MFGKKKQKQETLVRMRNLAQLDEGFFAHMKDGKDMFDATAREIRNTYQQLGAGITQIQENIKEASQMAADNGEKEQELTGQLASYQEQEVQSSEKREQMLQNFAQIEQEMAQLVEENKHFTTPSKFLNEFPVALKAENEKTREELEKMQDNLIAKQSTVKQMLSDKKNEIAGIQKDIKKNASKLSALEQAAADAARKKQEAASSYSSGAGASVVSGNGTFTHPCPGYSRISSYFGYREQPLAGASTNHKGMDFAAPTGTPIYAAAGGTVVSAGYSGKAGNLIVINHGNGLSTYYMHCHKIYVRAGQKVSKGQNIAIVGTTGNSTGPHLHFQVMSGGVPVNPLKYL